MRDFTIVASIIEAEVSRVNRTLLQSVNNLLLKISLEFGT